MAAVTEASKRARVKTAESFMLGWMLENALILRGEICFWIGSGIQMVAGLRDEVFRERGSARFLYTMR